MINKFIKDVAVFHERFKLSYNGPPRKLDVDEYDFRNRVHHEEANEYEEAVTEGDLEKQLDALVDLVYFALGTADRQGLPFQPAWDRVHEANMQKVLAGDPEKSLRGFARDVVKPAGWQPPVFTDLFQRYRKPKPRLIVVEGPDACGKTTMAKELARSLGGVYWHMTATSRLTGDAQFDYQINAIENVIENLKQGRSIVMDRAWPSEWCYGRVLRGVEWADISPLKFALEGANPYYIYCMDRDAETANNRHKQMIDDAHPYNEEQYLNVYDSYVRFLLDSSESGVGGDSMTVKLFDSSPDWSQNLNTWIHELKRGLNLV